MPSSKTKEMPGRVTGASLDRLIDEQRLLPDEIAAETSEMTSMLQRMRQIGRRTAELHHALASHDVDGFAPEPIAAEDSARWSEAIAARAARVFEMLQTNADRLAEPAAARAQGLLGQREAIFAHIEQPQGRALYRQQDPPSRRFPSWPGPDRQG